MDTIRYRLNLAYDGGAYKGWQVQPDVVTIQGKLQEVLSKLHNGQDIKLIAAGRTDTGVHAIGQVAHFDAPPTRDAVEIRNAINALVGDDIRVWRVRQVPDDFHARFSARERIYGYRILLNRDVFRRHYGWRPSFQFDPERVSNLSEHLLGKHNFRSFSTKPDPDDDPVCNVRRIRLVRSAGGWLFLIAADRFLRRMVRTIVGTLLEAAAGRFKEDELIKMLETEGERTGTPAPANGLALLHVKYEIDDEEDNPNLSLWGDVP